jgi:ankyrin repeat protein
MQAWTKLLEENDYIGIKKQIQSGGDLAACNEHDESVLALAIKMRCDEEIIDLLISSGADIHHCDEEGVSMLDFAIAYNNYDLVSRLIEEGINVSETERKSGFTPLMGAVCYNRYEILKLLLKKNPDLRARDASGFTAYTFAKKMRKQKMMDILTEHETSLK